MTGQLIGEEGLSDGMEGDCAMDKRMRFVIGVEKREEPFAAICRQFGVSRKADYKWLARYREAGVEGLIDRSRVPLASAGGFGRDRRALRCGAPGPSTGGR